MGGGDGLVVCKHCVCQDQKKLSTAPAQKKTAQIVSEFHANYRAKNAQPECLSSESSEYIVVASGLVRCSGTTKKGKRCRRTKKNPCVLEHGTYFCDLHELQALQPAAPHALFLIRCSGLTLKGTHCQRTKLAKQAMNYFCFQHEYL